MFSHQFCHLRLYSILHFLLKSFRLSLLKLYSIFKIVDLRSFEYNAKVYYQCRRKCNNLDEPRLDDSYAERITYRLKK